MKCPMRTQDRGYKYSDDEKEPGECIGEGCAWWVKAANRCAILQISSNSAALKVEGLVPARKAR
jgi:hypothetical protein